jgi:hypothetical protein
VVEGGASVLQGPGGFARGKQAFGQGQSQVDRVLAEAAGIGKKNAGLAFRDRLRVVAERALQLARGVKTAKLEFHTAGTRGKGPRIREMARSPDWVILADSRQESIASAQVFAPALLSRDLAVILSMADRLPPKTSKSFEFSRQDAGKAGNCSTLNFGRAFELGSRLFNLAERRERRCATAHLPRTSPSVYILICQHDSAPGASSRQREVSGTELQIGEVLIGLRLVPCIGGLAI